MDQAAEQRTDNCHSTDRLVVTGQGSSHPVAVEKGEPTHGPLDVNRADGSPEGAMTDLMPTGEPFRLVGHDRPEPRRARRRKWATALGLKHGRDSPWAMQTARSGVAQPVIRPATRAKALPTSAV
jgi:hypothetical protein